MMNENTHKQYVYLNNNKKEILHLQRVTIATNNYVNIKQPNEQADFKKVSTLYSVVASLQPIYNWPFEARRG